MYSFPWWRDVSAPGVYLIYGGRQVGKTTSLKQYIDLSLTNLSVQPEQTFFLPCDTVSDRDELHTLLRDFLVEIDRTSLSLVVVDEVTFIPNWQLSIKALIDEGLTYNVVLIITGSDRILLEDGAAGFPGIHRRGRSGKDIIINPLRFREYVQLTSSSLVNQVGKTSTNDLKTELDRLFAHYMETGGFLSALNEYSPEDGILPAVYTVYEQWILSDFLRKGKDKRKLRDLLRVVFERLATQVSFSKLAHDTAGLATETVIDYLNHLERLGVLKVLYAFDQNTRSAFPKKDKKIHFYDPFIAHVVHRWLQREGILTKNFSKEACLVEGIVASTLSDLGPVYYFKAKGEIDVVTLAESTPQYVEVKWASRYESRILNSSAVSLEKS